MVGVLISMKFAMLRHTPNGMRMVGWVFGALAVAATWVGVILAGDPVRAEVLMLALAGWGVGAAVGPVVMSGAGVLRADYFTLLPLRRSRLGLALLVATFPGIASGYVLVALLAVVVLTAGRSPAVVAVAVAGALATWVLVITTSRLVYAAVGSAMRTWLGVEIAAVQFGVLFAGLIAGWMVVVRAVQTVPQLLATGVGEDRVAAGLALLPTSWSVRAVDAAAGGAWSAALLWLAALVATGLLVVVVAALLLRPSHGVRRSRRARRPLGSRLSSGRRLWPDTPLGAVLGKELRQWWRDPWRRLELRSGVYTGVLIGLFALTSVDFRMVAPMSGLVVAFMVCLGACNLYGQDGTAIWLTVVGERRSTVSADVRGRQLAVILLFAPPAVLVSAVGVLVSGQHWAWPVLLAGLPAVLGAASGVAIVMSVVGVAPGVDPRRRVGPNDAGGDLGLQAQVAFWATCLLVTPTAAAVVVAAVSGEAWSWVVTVLAGLLNGALGFWLLGQAAVAYLTGRLPSTFVRIRYGRHDGSAATGVLGWVEQSSQQHEERARRRRLNARRDRSTTSAAPS